MSTKGKEDAGTPLYNEYGSPKLEEGINGESVKRVSFMMLLLIAMPRMAINMAWSAQWAALGPYLGTMLPKFAVQLTQIVGPTSGILVGPTIGVLSDRSTNKFGRRRPFLAIAGLLSIVCWLLMGYTREMGEALGDYGDGKNGTPMSRKWTAVLTVFFYIWMDVTVNVVQTPSFLLVADMAGDRQTTGAALAQGWSTLGSIMVSGYIEIWGPAHLTLHWFLGMLCVVMFICVGVVCVVVKEVPLDPSQVEQKSALKSIGEAFYSIYTGLRSLPSVLVVYCFIFFCVQYGYTAYNGNKGQFFGLVVYEGDATSADNCAPDCTQAQDDYNRGVQLAGGSTDLIFNAVGYVFSWMLPFLVKSFGAKWVLTIALVPQTCLIVMAFTKVVGLNVFFVVITSLSQNVVFALLVPIIVHVYGDKVDIGVYVGALNSANCFGQLLNFAIGAALVETSMGYKLPVLLGGIMSLIGVLVSAFFLKLKMNSLSPDGTTGATTGATKRFYNCVPTCTKAQDDNNDGVQVAGGSTDLIFNGAGYIVSWMLPFLVKSFGAKWVLAIALVVDLNVFFVVITSLSQGIIFVLLVPIIVHVYGDKVDIVLYVGALNSVNCFGQLLNFAIGAAIVETSMGYKLPVLLGGIMSLISVVISAFFLQLTMYSL